MTNYLNKHLSILTSLPVPLMGFTKFVDVIFVILAPGEKLISIKHNTTQLELSVNSNDKGQARNLHHFDINLIGKAFAGY